MACATWHAAFWFFSANFVTLPEGALGGTVSLGGIYLGMPQLIAGVVALVLTTGMYLLLSHTMLGSRLLVRVKVPKEGDLAFYGTGHVELFRKWGYTYGAHDSGTVISLVHYNSFWKPTAYYRIRTKR